MANLLINTTVGGNAVITTSNIGSYALTSIPATISPTNINIGNAIYFGGGNNYLNWDGSRINSNVGIQSTSDMRAPIFYDSNDTNYYGDFAGTSNLYNLSLTGAKSTYLTINPGNGYEAMIRYIGGSGSSWYVGKRMAGDLVNTASFHFFSEAAGATVAGIDTGGNFYTTGSLTIAGTNLTGTQTQLLKNTLDVSSLPYKCDIYVEGNADTFYPVHFIYGNQDVWRRIVINRGYGETAPWDPIGTGSHHGGLLLDWEGNFGGWGGAEYSDRLRVFNESYTNVCADMYIYTHSMGYVFMLRGGHSIYHIFSDQPINGTYQSGSPDIAYSTATLFYDDTWSGNNTYDVYAPAPLTLNQVNSSRIDGLRTKKQSLLDGRYLRQGVDIGSITNISASNFMAANAFYLNGQSYYLNSYNGGIYTNARFESAGIIYASGGNSSNWNTAYGWGNHASAGYLTGITSGQVTGALGYTPYNSSNPSSYITANDTTTGIFTTFLGNGTSNIGSSYTRVIRNENGAGGNPNYAPILHVAASDTMWQIAGAHGGQTTLVWRSGYSGAWNTPWWTIYHSGNFTDNSSNWNTAYGWGNHANAGYITSSGSISGTAGSISGFNNPTTASTANTIVYRDASGDVAAREFVLTSSTVHTVTPSSIVGIYPTTNQVVKFSASAIQTFLGLGSLAYSSATIPTNNNQLTNGAGYITSSGSISGNAATATYASTAGSAPANGGNSSTVGGYSVSVAGTANTIPTRNASGYLIPENWIQLNGIYGLYSPTNSAHLRPNDGSYGSWLVTGSRGSWRGIEFDSGTGGNVTMMINVDSNTSGFHNNSYGWQFRWNGGTLYCYKNAYGGGTEATVLDSSNYSSWAQPIASAINTGNIGSQSVSYASTAGSAGSVTGLTLTSSANGINPNSVTQNQIGYNTSVSLFGQTDGGLYSSAYSSDWIHQIYGDFRTGQIAIRGKNSGSWQAWRTVLDSSNYTSYSPSLTGSGASGTWGISVTGSAGSVAWTNVSSRPTALSQFTNDLGNYGGFLTSITAHTHAISDVTGLQTALDSKQASLGFTPYNSTNPSGYITSSASISGTASNITAHTINQSLGTGNSPTFAGLTNTGGWYSYNDDDRNPGSANHYPTTSARSFRFSFVGAGSVGAAGNYAGLLQFNPWDGTTSSTGDSSYQLAFVNQTGINGSGNPGLRLRKGIDSTWGAFCDILTSVNYTSYSPTLTGTGASGTWSISVSGNAATATNVAYSGLTGTVPTWNQNTTGNAATVGGYAVSGSVGANTVVIRDGNGYIYAHYINSNVSETENPTINSFYTSNGDGWLRKSSVAHVKSQLGLGSMAYESSGTYQTVSGAINTGNIASQSVSYATISQQLTKFGDIYGQDWNSYFITGKLIVSNALGHSGANRPSDSYGYGTALSYGETGGPLMQMYFPEDVANTGGAYRALSYRSGYNGSWSAWKTVVNQVGNTCTVAGSNGTGLQVHSNVGYNQNPLTYFLLRGQADSSWKTFKILLTGDAGGQDIEFRRIAENSTDARIFYVPRGLNQVIFDYTVVQPSDSRLKDNLTPITTPVDKIKSLRGVEFDWNSGEHVGTHDVGLIAQDVEAVLPEAVTTQEDGYKNLAYTKVIPLLVEAMKEQQTMIEALRAEIELLKNK